MSEKKPLSQSEWDELRRFKSEFLADFRHDGEWRKQKRRASNFYDGEQWDAEDQRVLEERGQPVVVINRIKPKIDSVCGMQQGIRVDTKAFPHGLRNKTAEISEISEAFRSFEHANEFDSAESKVFKDGLVDGRGWFEHDKVYDGYDKRCTVEHSDNANWVPHRYGTRDDLKDHRQLHKTVWQYEPDAKSLFPGHDEEIEAAANSREPIDPLSDAEHRRVRPDQYTAGDGSTFTSEDLETFVDSKSKRLRVVTTYYREKVMERMYSHRQLQEGPVPIPSDEDLKKLQESFPNGNVLTKMRVVLNSYTFTWNAPLEHKRDIRDYDREGKFPATKFTAYTSREQGVDYGLVKQHIDPQTEYNKRRSKMLHLLNVNRVVFEDGAFEDDAKARREIARPDTFLKRTKGFEVKVESNIEPAASQFQLLQLTGKEIDSSGVNQELEGRSNSSSGREYQMRQQQAMQSIRELFDNLNASRRRVFEYYLDELINDNPELAVSKYDVVVDEAPDTINLQAETFSTLASLAKSGLPIPPEMIIEVSPLTEEKKQEFLQKMQAMQEQQQQMLAAQMQAAQGGAPPAA